MQSASLSQSPLQVLMNNLDEFFGRQHLRSVATGAWIDHVFANVIFDDLRDETVQGTPAGSCLLQDGGAFVLSIDCPFHCLDLSANALETIE